MDDLRSKFLDELEDDLEASSEESESSPDIKISKTKTKKGKSSPLTTSQVFILASLLFFLILIVGFFVMLLTGKMVI